MRIVVIQTAYLGDVILTTPLLKGLAQLHPGATIHFVTTAAGALALQGLPGVIAHVYDKRRTAFIGGIQEMRSRLAVAARGKPFDLVIAVHRSFRSTMLARSIAAGKHVGFSTFFNRIFGFETVPYPPYDEKTHYADKVLALLKGVGGGASAADRRPVLRVEPEDERAIERKLGEFWAQPFCVMSPFSAWGTKTWIADRFADLAARLTRELGLAVIFCGDGDERGMASGKKIFLRAQGSGARCLNLIGRTSVPELIALVSRARLLVANDSAPVHVASAFDVPTVAVFGPTVRKFGFSPLAARSRVVERLDVECRPCSLHGPARCPRGHFRCMREIQVEDVFKEVQNVL